MNNVEEQAATRATTKEWASLGVLTLAVGLLSVDGTVLALAVPSISEDLRPTSTQVLWIGDIYSFALAGLLVTMGNVADRVGRKRLLLIGAACFGAASVLAAFAPSPEVLIMARALLGVAGSTLMPSTLSLVRATFRNPRQRTTAIAVWAAGASGGAAAGPLVGGALLEHFRWGSVFMINVPIIVVILVAGVFLLEESRGRDRAAIDLLSAGLSVTAIVPVVYAVKPLAGHGLEWSVPASAVLGVVAGVAFVRRQRHLRTPLIDLTLFRVPAFTGAILANSLGVFAFIGLLFFFSQYLQLVRGLSPLEAGIHQLPSTVASVTAVAVVGLLARRLGRGRAIGGALLVAGAGMGALVVTEGFSTYAGIALSLVALGLGVGVSMTLATDAVVAAVPRERAGAASAISETGYELGTALGIAVLGSLQMAFYRSQLDLDGVPAKDVDAVRESLARASDVLPPSSEVLSRAQEAFTVGMQLTSVCAAVLLVVGGVIALRVIAADEDAT
ncbi:MFS transporter [Arthrobacter sp. RIT-PI-e]|uniref:MFS transporter n=1 Tax=Arthrobacter sp. RIT-PI-e TaxID=1681197 RepID=UPI00067604B1|nr:MFS transporter [Arthrobacter sp. RIT-PI-e]KNC18352.1 MFS transporter [Arthrobacter sp. RIT-PI-e]